MERQSLIEKRKPVLLEELEGQNTGFIKEPVLPEWIEGQKYQNIKDTVLPEFLEGHSSFYKIGTCLSDVL